MKVSQRTRFIILAVISITVTLTGFYYVHESFPKPIRAVTAILAAPTAIASGISHYFHLGLSVYETPWAIVISNLFAALGIAYFATLVFKIKNR
jgi:ABC-type multidrug transport system permease subunit